MLQMTRGPAAAETINATERAAALAEKSGNLTKLVDWVSKKWGTAFVSGDLPAAATLENQALEIARREGSTTSQGRVYARQIPTRYVRGDLVGAEEQFRTGLKFFNDPVFKQDPGYAVATFGWASWNAWTLGRADTARERMGQMLAAANAENPYDVAFADTFAALLEVCMRGYEKAEASAARALELSQKYQFPYLVAVSQCILGQARAQLGRASEGVGLIRQGIAGMLEVGSRVSVSNLRLAEAQERAGTLDDALETVEHALRTTSEELVHRPETLKLRGELQLKQGHSEPAEADFREAIVLAQKMSARVWELRATMSLARLLAEQGRRDEARVMLADIYSWFTEGFDTRDLKDAKALLEELSA